jgi:hypothetical protein
VTEQAPQNTRMTTAKNDTGRCSERELLREVLSLVKTLDFEVRSMKWQHSLSCFDMFLPLLLIGLLGGPFNSNAANWRKEDMEEFMKKQKEKFSPASTPGAQQPE